MIDDDDILKLFSRELETIVYTYNRARQKNEEIKSILKNVEGNLTLKDNDSFYKEQLKKLSKSDDNNEDIVKLYIGLKEKCQEYEQNLLTSKKENEALKIKSNEEKENIEQKFLQQINKLKDELESQKYKFMKREQELQNELQGSQAAAAMEYDEMETKLKNLLSECEQKLHESNNSCNIIRSELIRTKQQMAQMSFILNSKQKECQVLQEKIVVLQERFFKLHQINVVDDIATLENDLFKSAQELNFENPLLKFSTSHVDDIPEYLHADSKNVSDSQYDNDFSITATQKSKSTYKPLDAHKIKYAIEKKDDAKKSSSKTKAQAKRAFNKKTITPLLQVTSSESKNNIKKKRKLYNLNDIPQM